MGKIRHPTHFNDYVSRIWTKDWCHVEEKIAIDLLCHLADEDPLREGFALFEIVKRSERTKPGGIPTTSILRGLETLTAHGAINRLQNGWFQPNPTWGNVDHIAVRPAQ